MTYFQVSNWNGNFTVRCNPKRNIFTIDDERYQIIIIDDKRIAGEDGTAYAVINTFDDTVIAKGFYDDLHDDYCFYPGWGDYYSSGTREHSNILKAAAMCVVNL